MIMVAHPQVVQFVYQGMKDVADTLNLLNTCWCATNGTLLGGFRDGGFQIAVVMAWPSSSGGRIMKL